MKTAKKPLNASPLSEKIAVAEERARFEEAHARIVEAKVRRLLAKRELEELTAAS